jgi:hypothetical protein
MRNAFEKKHFIRPNAAPTCIALDSCDLNGAAKSEFDVWILFPSEQAGRLNPNMM